jgi:hypothetical protein
MNSTKIFIIAIVLTAFSFGCKDDPYSSTTIDSVMGDWIWVKSTTENWLGKKIITPDSVGYAMLLKVKSDTIEYFVDGNLSHRLHYQTITKEEKLILNVDYGSYHSSFSVYFSKDTLVFNQAGSDGPIEYFIRQQ